MDKDSFNVGAFYTLLKRFIAICFCVLMFPSVAGVKSTVKECAYIGQQVKFLYKIDSDYADISLYRENATYIASWKGTTNMDIISSYDGKIFMDKKRNIWMFDVDRKDNGSYYLKFGLLEEQHEITLIVMEELTEEQPQECRNNHPDFTKEDGWNPLSLGLQIVTFIIVTITLLMKLANRNQIRKGLINMKDWIQKKLCSRHMPENEPQNQENESLIKVSGNLIVEQICQIRKLQDDHTEYVKEYLGNLIVEQIWQIKKLQDDHTEYVKKYLDEIKDRLPKLSKTTVALWPERNGTDIERVNSRDARIFGPGMQCSSNDDEQNSKEISKKSTAGKQEIRDSDADSNDEQDVFLKDNDGQNF